jgi:hypothetical protein
MRRLCQLWLAGWNGTHCAGGAPTGRHRARSVQHRDTVCLGLFLPTLGFCSLSFLALGPRLRLRSHVLRLFQNRGWS